MFMKENLTEKDHLKGTGALTLRATKHALGTGWQSLLKRRHWGQVRARMVQTWAIELIGTTVVQEIKRGENVGGKCNHCLDKNGEKLGWQDL